MNSKALGAIGLAAALALPTGVAGSALARDAAPGPAASTPDLPQPPAGAKKVRTVKNKTTVIASYTTRAKLRAVGNYYQQLAKRQGYKNIRVDRGGSGWGRWGAYWYTVQAKKGSRTLAVEVNQVNSDAVEFGVCLGTDWDLLRFCT